ARKLIRPMPEDGVVPPTERYARGQSVAAEIGGQRIRGFIQGADYRGRAVLLDRKGRRRIARFEDLEIIGQPMPRNAPAAKLAPGAILRPPARIQKALEAALEIEVAGPHRVREYVEAFWREGYEVYLIGGSIRDAIELHGRKPDATVEELLAEIKDID